MLYGMKVVATYLLGTDIAGRNLAIYPDDTFIVSYPRSGNTWTRFLIANLLYPGGEVSFANIEKLIPDASAQSSRTLKSTPRPRVIKTHEYFDHRYPKVIYIVRDPRDVALSYYDFHRKYGHIDDSMPLNRFVEGFVSGKLISSGWGTWAENVASWIYTREHNDTFLLLRYEDMLENTVAEVNRVAVFMGVGSDPGRLQQAMELSAADRMRKLEKQQEDRWLATLGSAARRAQKEKRRKDIPFVGGARAGGWRTSLPEESVYKIESAWGKLMMKSGYELVTTSRVATVARG
jgi:hypothetical protein